MRVISNTSPILNLAIIGQLDLLREQFGEITIPSVVLKELQIDQDRLGSPAIQNALRAGWIKVEQVQNNALVQALENDLDAGESQAIALALQQSTDFILLDERDARKSAKSFDLTVVGVLGVLLKARRAERLTSLRQAIQDLQTQAAFRIHPSLLAEIQALPEYQDIKPEKRTNEKRVPYTVKPRASRKNIFTSVNQDVPLQITRRGRRAL